MTTNVKRLGMSFETVVLSISQMGDVVTGKTPPSMNPEFWGEIVDFITPTDFSEDSRYISVKRKLSEKGVTAFRRIVCPVNSVMVTCIGSDMGKVAIASNDIVTNQQINTIKIRRENIDPLFAYYLLKSSKKILKRYAEGSGSTMPIINKSTFESLTFTVPKNNRIQQTIAKILGDLDKKIELNRKMNKTLEEMGQALFKHYFIDNPEAEGWKVGRVSELGEVITGKTPSKLVHTYFGGKTPFLKVPDMHGNSVVIRTSDSLTQAGARTQKNKTIPVYSTCVSCIATVGIISLAGVELQTNQQINSLIPRSIFFRFYNFFLLKDKEEYIKTMASGGTTTPNLNKGQFENIRAIIPPSNLLKKFDDELIPVIEMIRSCSVQIETLVFLRDSLLPRLMSGKIAV